MGNVKTANTQGRKPINATELNRLNQQIGLGFPKDLEKRFRADFAENSILINRTTFALGILMIAAFGAVDIWAAPVSLLMVWFIRFGILVPTVLVLLALSFTSYYPKIMQPAGALAGFIVGIGIIAITIVCRPEEIGHDLYIFGLMPVVVFLYTAPRLLFKYAAAASWAICICSFAILYGHDIQMDTHYGTVFVVSQAMLWSVNAVGMLACYFIELSIRRNFLQEQIIKLEQQRSDDLLLNILPAPIADRLKRGENVADYFSDVSVLFADIVDFTPITQKLAPTELIGFLNDTFSIFDQLAQKHGLEKIKTIGDCYMVVSGIPYPRPDHAEAIAEMALEMQAELERMNGSRSEPVELRIGLSTGPVVAGVIGLQKFIYDLWGDTVNTASRMEMHGLAGKIQVTEAIYRLLQNKYCFEDRGEISVKGKGKMQVYLLTGRKTPEQA